MKLVTEEGGYCTFFIRILIHTSVKLVTVLFATEKAFASSF